ncbi:O-antigen ligase family protein [bacterium]|nr:O-antigen ligase family protein [bacterium]
MIEESRLRLTRFERLVRRAARDVEEAAASIPRRYWELATMFIFAIVLAALALKSFILAFALIVAMLAALILVRRPTLLVYVLIAIIPISWVNLLGRRLRVITFMTAIGFAFFMSREIIRRKPARVEPLYVAIAAYVAICLLSLVNSVDVRFSLTGMKYYIISLVFGLTLIIAVRDRRQLAMCVAILIGWGVVQSLLAVAQSVISPAFFPAYHFDVFGMDIVTSYAVAGIRRASGTFESGPRLAMFLLLPLAFSITFFFRDTLGRRALWALVLIAVALGLFVSFTRIAVVLGVGYIGLYYFFERNKALVWRMALTVGLVAAIIGIILQFILPETISEAMGARFTQEGDQVYLDRFYFLYNALMAFLEKPILGWGIKTYTLHSWDFMQRFPVPWREYSWDAASLAMPDNVPVHNDYGRMLAETGILSLAAFIAVYVITFRNYRFVIRHTRNEFDAAIAVGLTLFLAAMCAYWFFHEYIMEEPFVSVLPFAFSIVLKRLTEQDMAAADTT